MTFSRFIRFLLIATAVVLFIGFGGSFLKLGLGKEEKGAIGIVTISGPILESESVLDLLHRYEKDDKIRAILLRIESPGGAVGPSQEIYSAVMRIREKKPVVASLGGMAASGAFYIASACSEVVANPGTLTGSIGVIIQLMDLSDLLKWAKVKIEVIKTGEFKDAGGFHRPLTPKENEYFQELARKVLSQFVRDVARGRAGKIVEKKIWSLADGRVFTGEEAKSVGLVDEVGGWDRAVEIARRLGKIEGEPELVKPRRRFWERFLFEEKSDLHPSDLTPLMNPLWVIYIP